MIHVIAVLTAKPGKRDEVLRHFHANVPAVLAEKGCVEYVPTVDAADAGPAQAAFGPDTFVVVEKWETMADLAAHSVSPHMKEYGARTKDLLASRSIHILEPHKG
ncbi:putative quinol monooxygenase [Enterovirga sp.]|uniref:putative quinol monooxygenase n=1 Tax=Enterovirga sp. TaxID=2026350 RepID=UPI002CBCBD73|nr:putative quinol monooxygenase [Enterovirga sp.]HMO28599.1 putative quinol monooxygenase [Enterovirga sp.]